MAYEKEFLEMRGRLFGLAYKLTRSVADAEDVLQETFLAIGLVEPGRVREPAGYMVRVVTNGCLKLLEERSLMAYPGTDLPEPLEDGRYADLDGEDLSYGMLLLLQRLKPVERAVFVLRESFDFEYAQIGEVLSLSPENCRQLLHRAKERVKLPGKGMVTTEPMLVDFMRVFMEAAVTGDVEELVARLREDVVVYADGGGRRPAALQPVGGRDWVQKYLLGVYHKWSEGLTPLMGWVNGEPAIILYESGTGVVDTVMLLGFEDGLLAAIYMVRNVDKLSGVRSKEG